MKAGGKVTGGFGLGDAHYTPNIGPQGFSVNRSTLSYTMANGTLKEVKEFLDGLSKRELRSLRTEIGPIGGSLTRAKQVDMIIEALRK